MKVAKSISPLIFILLLGAVLRFWNLDFKPLWMDEIITALFGLGQNYYNVPLEQALPLSAFEQVFTLNAGASCPQITATVSMQSVHPPLFFCWMHNWLKWVDPLPMSWVWKLRALPALFGVVAIAAIYQLSSIAFSTRAGIISAIVMAVSPFGIYLSQEARHYTLPFLLVTLTLIGLYYILLDLRYQRISPLRWLGWIVASSISFYVHYFFLLAFAAQLVVLLVAILHPGRGLTQPEKKLKLFEKYVGLGLAIALVCFTWLPWLTIFLSHIGRSETNWLQSSGNNGLSLLLPLLQVVMGLIVMTIALPVENQPIWIAITSGLLMFLFAVGFVRQLRIGIQHLWQESEESQLAMQMLMVFIGTVLLEFLAIAYLFGKDLTQVPRYNFVYFPAFCALTGAALSRVKGRKESLPLLIWLNKQTVAIVLMVGVFSTTFVLSNQVFQKPYVPEQVAANLYQEPTQPLFVVAGYKNFQDIALELSFAIALNQTKQQLNSASETRFALISYFDGYETLWQRLPALNLKLPFPLNFWMIAPGLRRRDYPEKLSLKDSAGTSHTCLLDPKRYYRIGIPYQLYRCS